MTTTIITAVITGIVCLVAGGVAGYVHRKKTAEAEIGSAEAQARKILEDGIKTAENKKKEALIEAKEEILQTKNAFEQELNERRSELTRQERRVASKEDILDRKTEALEKKDETLTKKLKETTELNEQIAKLKEEQYETLQKVAGMTAEEAVAKLVNQLEAEIKHEQAQKIVELEAQFKDAADDKAREIIALAVQRCAADHVSEITVSVVNLPSEEMKGRIIGREGRNIRTIETLTGVDLIVDDTPEAIAVSSFDPV
ncbi:MAG: DUF3552 domain-containing protein, partial [Clostridia bacterium]|nr:DUF3552 domain-containing protein [Clostridia bacterium]